ncbi:MAG: methyltransferase domain-containing protein [bacterium]|nr:methyltransferase domain-containing protein [bacterium]
MKLHVGCGEVYIPGWIHVDERKFDHVDHTSIWQVCDAADVVYASHVLEHTTDAALDCPTCGCNIPVSRTAFLGQIHRILTPGGTLRVAVPDGEAMARLILDGQIDFVQGMLHGRQDYPENIHYVTFTFDTLKRELEAAGFKDIRRYDWRETEHADIDDRSRSYYPHMDFDGLLLSLNVEATA